MWLPNVLHYATMIGETFEDLIVLATCMHIPYFLFLSSKLPGTCILVFVLKTWSCRGFISFCSSSIAIMRTFSGSAIITASSAKTVGMPVLVSSQETSYPTRQSSILVLILTNHGSATLWYFSVLKSTEPKTLLDLLHSLVHSFVAWRVCGIWIPCENHFTYIFMSRCLVFPV